MIFREGKSHGHLQAKGRWTTAPRMLTNFTIIQTMRKWIKFSKISELYVCLNNQFSKKFIESEYILQYKWWLRKIIVTASMFQWRHSKSSIKNLNKIHLARGGPLLMPCKFFAIFRKMTDICWKIQDNHHISNSLHLSEKIWTRWANIYAIFYQNEENLEKFRENVDIFH